MFESSNSHAKINRDIRDVLDHLYDKLRFTKKYIHSSLDSIDKSNCQKYFEICGYSYIVVEKLKDIERNLKFCSEDKQISFYNICSLFFNFVFFDLDVLIGNSYFSELKQLIKKTKIPLKKYIIFYEIKENFDTIEYFNTLYYEPEFSKYYKECIKFCLKIIKILKFMILQSF